MTVVKKINLADLARTYDSIPNGEYEIKLINMDTGISSNGNPQVIVTYVITKGPHKGSEVMQWYTLKVGRSEKTGKTTCIGLSTMANIYKKIGVPEKEYAELSPDKIEAGRLFRELLKDKILETYISTEPREDDPNKTSTNVKILGLASSSPTTNGTTNRSVVEDDDEDIPL